jgi:hypothetical protein
MPIKNPDERCLKTKKASDELMAFIQYLIFVIIIFVVLILFIRESATGNLLKEQILAKQVALLIDIAKPGTEIMLDTSNFAVNVENGVVNVKAKPENPGYSYSFFSKHKIETSSQGDKIKIRILE